jgi:hypothetical protein
MSGSPGLGRQTFGAQHSMPPQSLQLSVQTPLLQASLVPHLFPHLPQLFSLVARLASHPFAALPSQSVKPALQAVMRQPVGVHSTPRALSPSVQGLSHPPQWALLVVRFVSQPLAGFLSQEPHPALQSFKVHAEFRLPCVPVVVLQVSEAVFRNCGKRSGVQVLPQAPQSLSVLRGSQPFAISPSQLPVWALQSHLQVHALAWLGLAWSQVMTHWYGSPEAQHSLRVVTPLSL